MFNHIYKEFNEIYHEATLKMGLSDSAFDILYSIVDLVFEIAPLHNPANLEGVLSIESRLLILPLKKWQVLTT